MPLALSRTARTLNSWAPNGTTATHPNQGPAPDASPQKASPQWKPPAPKNRRQNQGLRAAALKTIEQNLKPFRHKSGNGFAQEPKPKSSDLPFPGGAEVFGPPVRSPSNQNVHFDTDRRHPVSLRECPVQSVCPDAFVQCASPLVLATGSPRSIGHLRKWNSQDCLGSDARNGQWISEVISGERPSLLRNASLPDLVHPEQTESAGLKGNRPRSKDTGDQSPLMLSPSDTGRTLCFWLDNRKEVEAFHKDTMGRRAGYNIKLALHRHQKQDLEENPDTPPVQAVVRVPTLPQIEVQFQSDLLTLGPELLAQELTQLARELLLAVEPSELMTYVMKPRLADTGTCPNLHRLLLFYGRLSSLVTSEILWGHTPSERAQRIALFVQMANQCESLQNWQSCTVLLSGIQSPPVVRLRETWYHLSVEFPDHFQMFEQLLLGRCGPQDSGGPEGPESKPRPMASVPYFGEILSHVRALPTVQCPSPPRALWKEPPSLAEWVEEQTTPLAKELNLCQETLSVIPGAWTAVLGKNLFCPVHRATRKSRETTNGYDSVVLPTDYDARQRLSLAPLVEDPETLPLTSRLVQCCALHPGSMSHIRSRVEVILRSAQAAARAYDIQSDHSCRRYWLQQPYSAMASCMKRSQFVESPPAEKEPKRK